MSKINKNNLIVKIIIFFSIFYIFTTLYSQQKEIQILSKRVEELKTIHTEKEIEYKKLVKDFKNIDNDAFIEKQAREKLKMVKENEIVFIDINKKENVD